MDRVATDKRETSRSSWRSLARSSMSRVTVTRRRSTRARLALISSALVYLVIGPDACRDVTHRADFALMPTLAAEGPANYTYTVIADVTNCFNIGNPVLNNE